MPKEGQPLTDDQIAALDALDPRRSTLATGEDSRVARTCQTNGMSRSSESTGPGSRSQIRSCRPCSDPSWPRDELDRFILAGLEKAGLEPVEDADRAHLLRRVRFDLTGLPPTPEEIDAFLKDASPDSFARLVDGCSPRRSSASAGASTGSTWRDTQIRRAPRGIFLTRTPGSTGITSSTR